MQTGFLPADSGANGRKGALWAEILRTGFLPAGRRRGKCYAKNAALKNVFAAGWQGKNRAAEARPVFLLQGLFYFVFIPQDAAHKDINIAAFIIEAAAKQAFLLHAAFFHYAAGGGVVYFILRFDTV